MLKHTPLNAVHSAMGATMVDFAGWQMPLRYSSETAEHHAVRNAAALFDLSHMGQIEVNGAGATAALDHALVSNIDRVAVGKAKYTLICSADGGVIDDLIVYRLREDGYLVVANAGNAATVAEALRIRATGHDAVVEDASDNWALIGIQGPRAQEILHEVTHRSLTDLRYYAIAELTVAGCPVLLARTGYTGEDGFELLCAPSDAGQLWSVLAAAGANFGLLPAGLACRDTLRLEAGMPLYGQELTTDLTPYEAGLGRVVALDKPAPFVGRAALVERSTRAIGRRLVGLVPDGRRSPRSGYRLLDPETGEVVGIVTSGAPSPTLGHPIAMAYVDLAHATVGSAVHVDIRGLLEPARVVDLPFYRRTR
ncbi:MAG: glycine cleavage system aminomethyltransferase GcvT [Oryzihumus sp.]